MQKLKYIVLIQLCYLIHGRAAGRCIRSSGQLQNSHDQQLELQLATASAMVKHFYCLLEARWPFSTNQVHSRVQYRIGSWFLTLEVEVQHTGSNCRNVAPEAAETKVDKNWIELAGWRYLVNLQPLPDLDEVATAAATAAATDVEVADVEIADDAIVAEDVVKLEIEDRLFDQHGAGPALRNLQRKSLYPIRDRKNYFSKMKLNSLLSRNGQQARLVTTEQLLTWQARYEQLTGFIRRRSNRGIYSKMLSQCCISIQQLLTET